MLAISVVEVTSLWSYLCAIVVAYTKRFGTSTVPSYTTSDQDYTLNSGPSYITRFKYARLPPSTHNFLLSWLGVGLVISRSGHFGLSLGKTVYSILPQSTRCKIGT